ncbi:MAG: type 1 glutamine amidotransferase domain-containing protein [Vampirovibrionales bacterium]|nr:type 1 glutamine amidotransferase domain-containing protein [Vampirovibrionales bacterium]
MNELKGKNVLVFAGPDFEDRELFYPYYRFKEAGASVKVAGLGAPEYLGKCGVPITVDGRYEDFSGQKWDLVLIPGGWAPDKIRMNPSALEIVRSALRQDAVVAAICHAGWVLCSANVLEGRKVTSYMAIKDDMIHAGADWVNEEVVLDRSGKAGTGTIVTSRTPDDLPAFTSQIIALFAKVPIEV